MVGSVEALIGRQPSFRGLVICVAVLVALCGLFFYTLDTATIFFGHSRPRGQTALVLGGFFVAVALLAAFVPPRLPRSSRWGGYLLLIAVVVCCVGIAWFSFRGYALSGDEYSYLFAADTLRHFRLWNEPPPLGSAQTTTYVWIKDGKWVSQYPPGWPSVLALAGGSAATGSIAAALCIAFATYAVFELVRARADRDAAWLSALLFAVSPFALFNGATLFSHSLAAALTAWAMLLSQRSKAAAGAWPLVMLGACIGLLGLTRNVAALVALVAVGIDQIVVGRWLRRALLIGAGGFPFLVGLLAYQYAITGDPMMPVYWYTGRTLDRLYFDWPSIQQGLRHTFLNQAELALFTTPVIVLLLPLSLGILGAFRRLSASDIVMPLGMFVFVFYPLHAGDRMGPRYYFDFWPLAVVSIGAAMACLSGYRQAVFRNVVVVSVLYGAVLDVFLAPELRGIVSSRFDIFEVARGSGIDKAVVCSSESDQSGQVYSKISFYSVPRNGVGLGSGDDGRPIIFVSCANTTPEAIRAAYPDRDIWEYRGGPARSRGSLVRLPAPGSATGR